MYRLRLHLYMHAYKKACTCILLNFQCTIIVCAYVDTQIHIHTHIHSLTCIQTQAFNLPFVTRTYTRTYIPCTYTLTGLLEKGFWIWEGMVLCIRPSLAMGIHRGTLAYIRWGIQLECARGGEAGGGRQSCRYDVTGLQALERVLVSRRIH